MTFAEDASRIRKNPDIVARMRSFAYNLLRSQGIDNMKNARWRAALDLNQVLEITGLLLRTEQPLVDAPGRYPLRIEIVTNLTSVPALGVIVTDCVFPRVRIPTPAEKLPPET